MLAKFRVVVMVVGMAIFGRREVMVVVVAMMGVMSDRFKCMRISFGEGRLVDVSVMEMEIRIDLAEIDNQEDQGQQARPKKTRMSTAKVHD